MLASSVSRRESKDNASVAAGRVRVENSTLVPVPEPRGLIRALMSSQLGSSQVANLNLNPSAPAKAAKRAGRRLSHQKQPPPPPPPPPHHPSLHSSRQDGDGGCGTRSAEPTRACRSRRTRLRLPASPAFTRFPFSQAMELRVGRKYRLGKKIGSGSFGGAFT